MKGCERVCISKLEESLHISESGSEYYWRTFERRAAVS